jgi:predicted GNAT family N-acyltransferase
MADGYDFSFEPRIVDFSRDADTSEFDCGKPEINEFIRSDEVVKFHEYRLGHTRLVYDGERLAGFFTLAPYSFQSDAYDGSETKYGEKLRGEDDLPPAIPSRLIGKLGVDLEYTDRDLGEYLIRHIIADTLERNRAIPFRFIVLHSHEDVVDFYKQFGFVESNSGKDNSWENTIMFLDLEHYR